MVHGVQFGGAAVTVPDTAGGLFTLVGNAVIVMLARSFKGPRGLFSRYTPSIREMIKLKMVASNANTDFPRNMADFGEAGWSSVEIATAALV